jgi:hypothetical protein
VVVTSGQTVVDPSGGGQIVGTSLHMVGVIWHRLISYGQIVFCRGHMVSVPATGHSVGAVPPGGHCVGKTGHSVWAPAPAGGQTVSSCCGHTVVSTGHLVVSTGQTVHSPTGHLVGAVGHEVGTSGQTVSPFGQKVGCGVAGQMVAVAETGHCVGTSGHIVVPVGHWVNTGSGVQTVGSIGHLVEASGQMVNSTTGGQSVDVAGQTVSIGDGHTVTTFGHWVSSCGQ